jgi:hypothetical protein
MFEIAENPVWDDKVHGWGEDTPVKGGINGFDNIPIKELAHRTAYLKKEVADQVQALQSDIDAWTGRGGYLNEHDFETSSPTQEELTAYALSQIPSITDPTEIWNGTKIPNAFDNHVWILTNTQDTDPIVFEWTDQGAGSLTPFSKNVGGYILGADNNDPDGTIESIGGGKGKPKGWDDLEERIFNREHPIGSKYEQFLNDQTPEEMDWFGTWEIWSGRADGYRLSDTVPPAFVAYTQGADYAMGACVLWHLAGSDYRLYTAKESITNAPQYLDSVKWNAYETGDIVERRFVQGWTDADFAVGDQIADGDYAGKYVTEVIVPGGKFNGVEGGNRPTFVSGGVQQGRIENIVGKLSSACYNLYEDTPPFTWDQKQSGVLTTGGSGSSDNHILDLSTAVKTGPDNAPGNVSIRLWRRMPDPV